MKKIVLFDVCGTLVDVNSTYDYINFLIKHGIKPYYKIFFLDRFIWLFYHILSKLVKKDIKRDLAVFYMKGLNKKTIDKLNILYIEQYNKSIKHNVFKSLKEAQDKGDDIFLISASINPPIDILKSKYNLNGFSSELEHKDGKYTGKLKIDLLGQKEKLFQEKLLLLEDYSGIDFFTDNQEDISLINYFKTLDKKLSVHIVIKRNTYYWKKYFKNKNIDHEFIL